MKNLIIAFNHFLENCNLKRFVTVIFLKSFLITFCLTTFISCTKKNHYDERIINDYKDSVNYEKIIRMRPFIFTSAFLMKEFPQYIMIYADSLEGLNDLNLYKVKSSFCSLTKNDMIACEYLYRTSITNYNSKETWNEHKLLNPDKYLRQYVALRDRNNDLIVWINSYCTKSKSISDYLLLVSVCDGGVCFFEVKFNLTKMKLLLIMPNGNA